MVDICEPPYANWHEILKINLASRTERELALGAPRFKAIRDQLLSRAISYTKSLVDLARAKGLTEITAPTENQTQVEKIVMTGHQPVIYHPGLLYKLEVSRRFSRDTGAVPVQVVIDTDEGDAGSISWPLVSAGNLEIKRASIGSDGGTDSLYSEQRVADGDTVTRVFDQIIEDLKTSGLEQVASRVVEVKSAYVALAGESLIAANSIVRWLFSDTAMLEVPLSELLKVDEFKAVLEGFYSDAPRLVETYNATLDSYRKEHRISNAANPFPNMKIDQRGAEVPLWRILKGTRSPVFNKSDLPSPVEDDGGFLATRGSLTTLLLRAYCSDLFVHGLGGGKYDRFVEQFAKSYLGVTLPTFVVASRTVSLFPEKVAKLSREVELASNVKEMTSKTELFLGQGIFTEEEERQLKGIITKRDELRLKLQGPIESDQRSVVSRELSEENRKARGIIEQGSLKPIIASAAANEALLARWSFREFPFFYRNYSPDFLDRCIYSIA
jgi:hypothetical protein